MNSRDLKDFFNEQGYKVIIVADGETRTHEKIDGQIIEKTPAGGVSVAFDVLAGAASATYIARAKTEADKLVVTNENKTVIHSPEGQYTLKRLFLSEEEVENYYYGFSNQTLWPLCHIAFTQPVFKQRWYEGFSKVNQKFARAIEEEIDGKTFIWINDYQLSLVPLFLNKPKDTVIGFFWHIPWPTWEIYRILPYKKDILWSLLSCDFLAFHRRYQVNNFTNAVERELEARIGRETNTIYFANNALTVANLPMGIDTDVVKGIADPKTKDTFIFDVVKEVLGVTKKEEQKKGQMHFIDEFFSKYDVMLGVDRLDYSKGIANRLTAIDLFFENNPKYIEKAVYIGIMAPSRDLVPAYVSYKKEVVKLAADINRKYKTKNWQPINLVYKAFTREDVIGYFTKAKLCLVTPLDDGMNLVSKEFVIASSLSRDPGVLVLSQFAGSATDLSQSIIVNPYDIMSLSGAIKRGLEMKREEKKERVSSMVAQLEEHNVYEWAKTFFKDSLLAAHSNR